MMEPQVLPSSCAVALKEWATVLEAMANGEQLVLIRKGGLIEPGSGFELVSPTFVFYPTFEHQAVNYLRPPFRRYFDEAVAHRLPAPPGGGAQAGAPADQLRIELCGVAISSVQSKDAAVVERLRAFHIYNDEFLTQRLKWQPEQPLMIVIVRAFRLIAPQVLPVIPHYAGCKSWVDLERPIPLEGVHPVLDDATFEARVRQLNAILAPV